MAFPEAGLVVAAWNAFSAFPPDALCRISPDEIRRQGRIEFLNFVLQL